MFIGKIRIREVNRYLKPVIKELLERHGKVTNPDFEDDLESITGIRYRMAKSYLYSPKPFQVVKDNSKIQRFILEQRRQHRIRRFAPLFLVALMIVAMLMVYQKIRTSAPSVAKVSHSISIPEYGIVFRLGDSVTTLKNFTGKDSLECEPVPANQAGGVKTYINCLYSLNGFEYIGPNLSFSYTYNTSNKILYQYIIKSTIPNVVQMLKEQADIIIKDGFTFSSKRITEKESSTTEITHKKSDQILRLTETFPGRPPFESGKGLMVGNFEVVHLFRN